jgi:pyridoxine 5-phosphate synthase
VELHTGRYCESALEDDAKGIAAEVERLRRAAVHADAAGLEVHAGHGLTYNTVAAVARMPEIVELNIGHFLIGEAIFGGMHSAIRHMRSLMDQARAEPRRRQASP